MNLHGIASGIVGAVNPNTPALLHVSTGNVQNPDGSGELIPSYAPAINVLAQVQPMTYRDLAQVEGLNLNGTKRGIYLRGKANGVVRVTQQGGDLITIGGDGVNAGVWLVAMVLEQWKTWAKVAATLQNGA